jgi:hypothetical protein
MKIERRTELRPVEITIYIADDGKKFKSLEECLRYEKECYKIQRLKEMKYFKETELGFDSLPVTEKTLDEDIWYATWIYLKTQEDVDFIINNFKEIYGTSDLVVGEIVCLETEGIDSYIFDDTCYVYPLKFMTNQIREYLAVFDLSEHNYEKVIGYRGITNDEEI